MPKPSIGTRKKDETRNVNEHEFSFVQASTDEATQAIFGYCYINAILYNGHCKNFTDTQKQEERTTSSDEHVIVPIPPLKYAISCSK